MNNSIKIIKRKNMKLKLIIVFCSVVSLSLLVLEKSNNANQSNYCLFLSGIESLAGGEASYSCKVSSKCYSMVGLESGEIECTGTKCSRGNVGLWGAEPWVECDGNKTTC